MDDWSGVLRAVLEMVIAGLTAGGMVGGLCWWVLLRKMREEFVPRDQFMRTIERVGTLEDGVATINGRLDALPTAESVNQILLRLEGVRGDLRAMREKAEGQDRALARLERAVDRLTDHHIESGS